MAEKIPAYAIEPLRRCLRSLKTSDELLHISMRGIGIVSNFPKMSQRMIDLTAELGNEITDDLKADLEESKRLANFADDELKNGFPFLHAFATVGAWSTLEVTIEDMLVGILVNEPEILGKPDFAKIRVPLAKYELLDKEERMRLILSELVRAQAATAGQGVNTFESVLQCFELSGEVDEGVRKLLWELNHVRNIIVHRDSYADLRLLHSCPWLHLKTGDRILIDHEKYGSYVETISKYGATLVGRLEKRYGVTFRSSSPD
jgi:hypothetical protein